MSDQWTSTLVFYHIAKAISARADVETLRREYDGPSFDYFHRREIEYAQETETEAADYLEKFIIQTIDNRYGVKFKS
jgi:hypothetical protein